MGSRITITPDELRSASSQFISKSGEIREIISLTIEKSLYHWFFLYIDSVEKS
jgi:hypothetical protein